MPQEGFLGKARGRDNGGQRHEEGSHLGDSQSIALRLHPKSNASNLTRETVQADACRTTPAPGWRGIRTGGVGARLPQECGSETAVICTKVVGLRRKKR